jgi:hypothetical protein
MYGLMVGLVALSLVLNSNQINAYLLVGIYFITGSLSLMLFKKQTKASLVYVLSKLKKL